MTDFWEQFDKSYRLFSQYCDTDDWHIIIKSVAGAVVKYAGNPNRQISILDVGCGSGAATQTVCEQVYARTGCFPSLSVVEPSSVARGRLTANILPKTDCGPLHYSVNRIGALPVGLKVDVILYLHSTYYIKDLYAELSKLIADHLRPGGAVCALVLPEQSPFFLGLPCLLNCSDTVERTFKALKMETYSFTLRSRFLLPKGGDFSEAEWEAMRKFIMPSATTVAALKERLNGHKDHDGNIDFQDHLLIGKKLEN